MIYLEKAIGKMISIVEITKRNKPNLIQESEIFNHSSRVSTNFI